MSPFLVALCYGSALALSLFLLQHFGVTHWYWHALSLAAALVLGLTPLPEALNTPQMTLVVGWVFTFFFVWGLAAPVFALLTHPPHIGGHHYR
jgi:hypothetical protein